MAFPLRRLLPTFDEETRPNIDEAICLQENIGLTGAIDVSMISGENAMTISKGRLRTDESPKTLTLQGARI